MNPVAAAIGVALVLISQALLLRSEILELFGREGIVHESEIRLRQLG